MPNFNLRPDHYLYSSERLSAITSTYHIKDKLALFSYYYFRYFALDDEAREASRAAAEPYMDWLRNASGGSESD